MEFRDLSSNLNVKVDRSIIQEESLRVEKTCEMALRVTSVREEMAEVEHLEVQVEKMKIKHWKQSLNLLLW